MRTADFAASTTPRSRSGIRIFGPNATAAQDIEPEYIAVSHDSKTAWVTLPGEQRHRDHRHRTAKVTRAHRLGFKDHSAVDADAKIYTFDPAALPSIGATAAGQKLFLGGFSGLALRGHRSEDGQLQVRHAHRPRPERRADRHRPAVPAARFTPEIVRFELDRTTGELTITQRIPLQSAPGIPLTGLPTPRSSDTANTPYNDEVPVDLLGNVLPLDPLGADLEGIVIDPRTARSGWSMSIVRRSITSTPQAC